MTESLEITKYHEFADVYENMGVDSLTAHAISCVAESFQHCKYAVNQLKQLNGVGLKDNESTYFSTRFFYVHSFYSFAGTLLNCFKFITDNFNCRICCPEVLKCKDKYYSTIKKIIDIRNDFVIHPLNLITPIKNIENMPIKITYEVEKNGEYIKHENELEPDKHIINTRDYIEEMSYILLCKLQQK